MRSILGNPVDDAAAAEFLRRDLEFLDGRRVLLVIPDLTRTAPIPLAFHALFDELSPIVAALDVLVALGTHPPLTLRRFCARIGVTEEAWAEKFSRKCNWFNHAWDDDDALREVGVLAAGDVEAITEGRMTSVVPVRINKHLLEYDHVIVIGPVFPHEVAGFSGGSKYFFPGAAGPELIDMFHWLGALVTNPLIIGHIDTPVRAVLERAARLLPFDRTFINLVVSHGSLRGIFIGRDSDAWRAAAALSAEVNIRRVDRPYRLVVGVAHTRYDDLWTAAKVVYKSEPVVADGGEVVVYAPHIREISVTHGRHIEAVGYHTRDYFVLQPDRFADVAGSIRAHSTHVRGIGSYIDGVERPRIQVTLATAIPPEVCARINLGYRDPASIVLDDYANREDEGILLIRDAGEVLYRLREGAHVV